MSKSKSKKGEVAISVSNNCLRLRWSFRGKRYCFYLQLSDTPENWKFAEVKARTIELDLKFGQFDPSLNKYRNQPQESQFISAVELFKKFFDFKKSGLASTTQSKYNAFLAHLTKKLGKKSADLSDRQVLKIISWLESDFKPSTAEDRLTLLKAAWRFGQNRGLVARNPWKEIHFRKEFQEKPKPFTIQECHQIIKAFKDRFPHYAPMVEFRLITGLRTGELAALEWGAVSTDCTKIKILKAFNSSARKGERIRPVKAGKVRTFRLPPSATKLLLSLPRSGDLVFPAPEGGYLRCDNFSKRQWEPVLQSLGIDYRRPYTTRHTLTSHALDRGQKVLELAEILGNTPRTIYQDYASQIGEAELLDILDLPD